MTVDPVSRHEVGRRIEDDGPLLPAACIWLSDSTEIGSCPPAEVEATGVEVAGVAPVVVGTDVAPVVVGTDVASEGADVET